MRYMRFAPIILSSMLLRVWQHAAGCGICVNIAHDVMRMQAEGKQPGEIRSAIDATYGSFGPATDTPLPNG